MKQLCGATWNRLPACRTLGKYGRLDTCLTNRSGMTLLEVLLAAVILAGALAALSQLATNGINASLRTEMETIAAVKCQSKLDEILAMPHEALFDVEQSFSESHEWTWIAKLSEGPSRTLSVLSVIVKRKGNLQTTTGFELSRLVSNTFRDSNSDPRLAGDS